MERSVEKPGKCVSNYVITMQPLFYFSLLKQQLIPKLGLKDTTTCGCRARESAEWLRLHLQL